MKCPKCGYHSFEYLERCRKCGNDLAAFKSKYNLRSMILPKEQGTALVSASAAAEDSAFAAESAATAATASAAAKATDFGFEFMDETPAPGSSAAVDSSLAGADASLAKEDAAPVPPAAFDSDVFDWNAEDEGGQEAAVANGAEEVGAAVGDETFGLDLSWDAELPVLEQTAAAAPEDSTAAFDTDSLSDWDFDAEPPPEDVPAAKSRAQEAPRDPFDVREPVVESPVPEVDFQPHAPAVSSSAEGTEEPAAAAAAVSAVAAAIEFPPLPAPESAGAGDAEERQVASLGPRSLALGVDLLLLSAVLLLFLIAGERALAPGSSGRLLPTSDFLLRLAIPYFLVSFSLCFGYFTLFHFLVGQTPGKMFLRLRVETENGLPLEFSHAFLRSSGGLFAMLAGGLGFLGILSPRRRGWNDRFAGTRVVSVTAEEDE